MNRKERRERLKVQARAGAALQQRAARSGSAHEALQIAQRLFQLGKSNEALPGLRLAVAAYPDDPDIRGSFAYALASTGQVTQAIEQYRALLGLQPDAVPVLTNLAFLLVRTGDLDDARRCLERASELAPEHANTAFALAELLVEERRGGEAFHHYRRAAELFRQKIGPQPDVRNCDDLVKLGSAQMWLGDTQSSLRSFELVLEVRPNHVLALTRRSLALIQLRRVPEAIGALKRAAAAAPDFAEIHRALGELYTRSGESKAAQREYEAAARMDPGDDLARFLLAATRRESPESSPPEYVKSLFDDYARRYEHHLVEVLRFRAPEIVCGAVLEVAGTQATDWEVIDLGCGTGLNGPLIRRAARRLIGVDLSPGMLEEARKKSVYDELRAGDIAQVLSDYDGVFDLALCTDVMVYLGNLTPIFAAAARALKPGALFAFTTEIHAGEGFVLDTTRRYRHSRGYVEQEAGAHGFAVVRAEGVVARFERQEPDEHDLFIVRRG